MCLSRPKMPSQQVINQSAPLPPPPPTELAEEIVDKKKKDKKNINRRGASSLTIRRPSVSVPTSGSGANVNY